MTFQAWLASIGWTWKKETPTKPGWYFWRHESGGEQVIMIVDPANPQRGGGLWCGPIPEPLE